MKELRNKNVKSVFGGIGIATLLCVLMVLMSWSAMVTNSDINSESAVETDSQDTKIDNMDKVDVENPETSFEAERFGFDEDSEMLGMRTENSKTFLDDQGKQQVVVSNKPLHYTNSVGQLIDIDTSIKTWDNGYYVQDIYNPVAFGNHANQGFVMSLDNSEIVSGLDPVPVIVMEGQTLVPQLPGMKGAPTNVVDEISMEYFTAPNKPVEVGGPSILYPLAGGMDLQYHVSPNMVKQELVVSQLSPELTLFLQSTTESASENPQEGTSMFGLLETMILPENTELWAGDLQITSDDGLISHNGMLSIRDGSTGAMIAYIDAPQASDSSTNQKSDEIVDSDLIHNVQYFISLDDDGQTLEIITAVNTEWLLDEHTVFPVLIDPSVGANTETTLTTPGSYGVCVVADVDCYTRTDGRHEMDYGSSRHLFSPWFDFEFTTGTGGLSVSEVTAYVSYTGRIWYQSGSEYTSIQILEDCGGSLPDGSTDLTSFANPSG